MSQSATLVPLISSVPLFSPSLFYYTSSLYFHFSLCYVPSGRGSLCYLIPCKYGYNNHLLIIHVGCLWLNSPDTKMGRQCLWLMSVVWSLSSQQSENIFRKLQNPCVLWFITLHSKLSLEFQGKLLAIWIVLQFFPFLMLEYHAEFCLSVLMLQRHFYLSGSVHEKGKQSLSGLTVLWKETRITLMLHETSAKSKGQTQENHFVFNQSEQCQCWWFTPRALAPHSFKWALNGLT